METSSLRDNLSTIADIVFFCFFWTRHRHDLTEAHREYADYRRREGVSVRQSSFSIVFDRAWKLVGERNVDQVIGFGVTKNSKFSENIQVEEMVDRTGKP